MKNLILNIILLISTSMHSQSIDLLNPEKNIGLDNWNIVNDDVMGGISTSYLSVSDEKNLIFIDNVLLETEDKIEITASKISVSLDTTLIQANGPVKGIFSNNNVFKNIRYDLSKNYIKSEIDSLSQNLSFGEEKSFIVFIISIECRDF